MMEKIRKNRISFILGLVFIVTLGLCFLDAKILKWSFMTLIISPFFYFIWKLVKIYLSWFLQYMFNQKIIGFDKKVERPRLVFYLLFGTILLLIIFYYSNIKPPKELSKNMIIVATFVSLNVLGTFCLYMLFFTWSKSFSEKFIPEVQKSLLKNVQSGFQLKWKDETFYMTLFQQLNDADFIEVLNHDSLTQDYRLFSNVLIKGEEPDEPLFKLNMDNVQTKLFFDLLSKESKGFPLRIFLKIFSNKNASTTVDSIYSSSSKNKSGAKREEEIKSFFDINKVKFLPEKVEVP